MVVCSGKGYYDLYERRQAAEVNNVALVRLEQIYPFPIDEFSEMLNRYRNADTVVWCQEEPRNQGAWYQIRLRLQEPLRSRHTLHFSGRPGAAAPAAGIPKLHQIQQRKLVDQALGLEPLIDCIDQ